MLEKKKQREQGSCNCRWSRDTSCSHINSQGFTSGCRRGHTSGEDSRHHQSAPVPHSWQTLSTFRRGPDPPLFTKTRNLAPAAEAVQRCRWRFAKSKHKRIEIGDFSGWSSLWHSSRVMTSCKAHCVQGMPLVRPSVPNESLNYLECERTLLLMEFLVRHKLLLINTSFENQRHAHVGCVR